MVSESTLSQEELWKPVAGYEGLYDISSLGYVRSYHRQSGNRIPFVLQAGLDNGGYYLVILKNKGRQRTIRVHVLVAQHFIGPRPSGYQVNHKDANKKNNHVANLEYITPKENVAHAIKNGCWSNTPGHGHAYNPIRWGLKLLPEHVLEIRALAGRISQKVIAKRFGISASTVSDIVTRRTWAKYNWPPLVEGAETGDCLRSRKKAT